MNTIEEILIQDTQKAFTNIVRKLEGKGDIEEVFASWLMPNGDFDFKIENIANEASARIGAFRSYSDIAILGFCADSGLLEENIINSLSSGLEWLIGRSITINGISTGLSQDPIALLGISLGARIISDNRLLESVSQWVHGFIFDAYEMRGIEEWQKCLIAAAGQILQVEKNLPVPEGYEIKDVLIALENKKVISLEDKLNVKISALHFLKSTKSTVDEPVRASLSLAACNLIMNEKDEFSTDTKQITMNNLPKKIKILFLAASPVKEVHLKLDKEYREIGEKLKKSKYRDFFELKSEWAVRIGDLTAYLMEHTPDIVHFSGHGSNANEIILLNKNEESHPVSGEKLRDLFSILKDNIRCVILNACYSDGQAQAIAEQIDCVIGMSDAIGDDSAIIFASHFYQALAFGRSVQDAFNLGCLQIDMENLEEGLTPKLICKVKDASKVNLLDE